MEWVLEFLVIDYQKLQISWLFLIFSCIFIIGVVSCAPSCASLGTYKSVVCADPYYVAVFVVGVSYILAVMKNSPRFFGRVWHIIGLFRFPSM